jgi:hypothetical protein
MKNLKTILLGLFAIISSTEITYPIFGTRRREAYVMSAESKKNEAAAYQAGMIAGSQQNKNQDSDSDLNSADASDDSDDVSIQRTSRREENNENYELERAEETVEVQSMSDQFIDQGNKYIDPAFAQNYADDATVEIQSRGDGSGAGQGKPATELIATPQIESQNVGIQTIGDGSMLEKFKNATPEEKMAIKNKIEAKIQAMEQDEDESDLDEDSSIDQALKDAGLDDDFAAATQNQNNVNIQAIEAELKHEDAAKPVAEETKPATTPAAPVAKADEPKKEEVKAPVAEATPAVKAEEIKAPVVQATPEVKAEEAKTPVVQAAPIVQAAPATKAADEVKIVKVYPMYDAVRSAIKGVHSATQDMLNYIYNFITAPAKATVVEVKAPKQETKAEVKIQTTGRIPQSLKEDGAR